MNVFEKIVHWSGIVIHAVLGGFQKADEFLDKQLPTLENALHTGVTIAQLFPGKISKPVEAGLNLGIELLGSADKVLNYTDETFQALVSTVQSHLPADSGYSVLLIPAELKARAEEYLRTIKAEADKIKDAANAITGDAGAPAATKPV